MVKTISSDNETKMKNKLSNLFHLNQEMRRITSSALCIKTLLGFFSFYYFCTRHVILYVPPKKLLICLEASLNHNVFVLTLLELKGERICTQRIVINLLSSTIHEMLLSHCYKLFFKKTVDSKNKEKQVYR